MSVYVITGVSKGIGFGLLRSISVEPDNIVVGLVRDHIGVQKKVAEELGNRPNIHILHGDLVNYASLEQAAADTAQIVGGRGVDYLVANGAWPSHFDAFDPIGVLGQKHEELDQAAEKIFKTNVTGNIHFFNLFIPLVVKGKIKKCIAISSGHGDLDFVNEHEVEISSLYGASKAALNIIVAKFQAQYKKDGILFFSISPGAVEVGHFDNVTPEQMQALGKFMGEMQRYAPHFKGAIPVDEGVKLLRSLWERASIESGYAGVLVSQHGNKQWM